MSINTLNNNIRLLSIFQFIYTGVGALLGFGFLFLHYFVLSSIFDNPAIWEAGGEEVPFDMGVFFGALKWVYIFIGVFLFVWFILNLLSGIFMHKRKFKLFSIIIGGINCTSVPLGTVLGVFTIILLTKQEAKDIY